MLNNESNNLPNEELSSFENDERVIVQPPSDEAPDYDEPVNQRDYQSVIYEFDENAVTQKRGRKKPPRVGFRRRHNSWYSGMTRQEIFVDTAKTAGRWLIFTVLAYVYWLAILLMLSMFLLNVWHVHISQILIYSGILCGISSLVYAYILVHRKLFY